MSDFNNPTLTSTYTNMVQEFKDRDVDMVKWLDGTGTTNLPSGAKRWNAANNYFEKFNGSIWSPLTAKYIIDVDSVDGAHLNDGGTGALDLWSASRVITEVGTKANTSHTHAQGDVTGLVTALAGKLPNTHDMSLTLTGDVTGTGTFTNMGNITSLVTTVANDSHTHDGRYFTEAEADARFLGISAKAADSADSDKLNGAVESTASTANTIVKRDASGDINARLFRSEYDTNNTTVNHIMTQIDTASNNYIRPTTPASFRTSVTDPYYVKSTTSTSNFNSTNSAGVINPNNTVENGVQYCNSVSLFGQTDGALHTQAYDSSWQGQIFQDYRTGQLAIRGKNNNVWQSWRTIYDSTNLTKSVIDALNVDADTLDGYNSSDLLGVSSDGTNTKGGTDAGGGITGVNNTVFGYRAGTSATSIDNCTLVGTDAGQALTNGDENTAIGYEAMFSTTGGYTTVAVGSGALRSMTTQSENVAVGFNAATDLVASGSVAVGFNALRYGTSAHNCVAVGRNAALDVSTGQNNTAVGSSALIGATTGHNNTCIGSAAGASIGDAGSNTYIGQSAGANKSGSDNTAIGRDALSNNVGTAYNNVAVGRHALGEATNGHSNTALGMDALRYTIAGGSNAAGSLCVGLGYNSRISADNQVQLGGSGTTTYAYGAVQNRSDKRDKTDIRDTVLGLDFIKQVRPVDFKWDYREDYFEEVLEEDDEGEVIKTLSPLPKDGSKKRSRYHHGVIAQEVEAVIKDLDIDFGGYQDHSIGGGEDVKSIGYEEFIAPLIKAVQELSTKNDELVSRIEVLEAGLV